MNNGHNNPAADILSPSLQGRVNRDRWRIGYEKFMLRIVREYGRDGYLSGQQMHFFQSYYPWYEWVLMLECKQLTVYSHRAPFFTNQMLCRGAKVSCCVHVIDTILCAFLLWCMGQRNNGKTKQILLCYYLFRP